MNATPSEKQIKRLKVLALRKASGERCTKNTLTLAANWDKLKTVWMRDVYTELVDLGMLETYIDHEYPKTGPRPQVFTITKKGEKELDLLLGRK